ncbi:putative ribonuclease H-like domain-containing protein [Tanacetum coccineum]
MVPRTILSRSGPISVNTVRPVITIQPRTTVNNAGPMKMFNSVKGTRVNTARPKSVLSAVKGNKGNAVKASAYWVWRPKHKILDHVSRNNGTSMSFKRFDYIDAQGRSKSAHDRKQILFYSYDEIDRILCAFGGRKLALSFMRPFGCPVTILNTIDHLGSGPNWLFDINALTNSMNYNLVVAGNQSNGSAGTKACDNEGEGGSGEDEKKVTKEPGKEGGDSSNDQEKDYNVNNINNINTASDENSTNNVNIVSLTVNAASIEDNAVDENIVYGYAFMPVRPIPTTRIHMDHLVEQIIRDIHSAPQTRRMIKSLTEHAMFSLVQQRTNHKDFQNCLFACFLSQEEPKKVFRNKKDERGIVIKNKERLVVQGYTQEEGIDCDEVFAPVARIEAIMLFLAYASYKDFVVYQMDVKSAFLYGKIEEEVYVCHPLGFEDPDFPIRVYKIEKELYGLHQVPRAWYETLSTYLLDNGFQRGKIDKNFFIRRDKGDILLVQVSMGELTFFLGLQVKQNEDGIFLSQDKYVTEILKKFGFSDVKTASTPMETHKPLLKDADGEDVDEHLYRSMIGSLMYLTSSRPDIMFVVCACARFQVNPKISHLHAVKRIFRYLKGCRLISWQCKKQIVAANSTTEAEYIAASNCCRQAKHIEIRHHFIRDSNEKKLIQMIKIHTNQNVVDLLTKAFDRIIHKGWLKWNAKATKDRIRVKTEKADFDEIVDFLNANLIRYALTVSPTIYVSCIEQFWSTAKTKTVNNETHIHAKVEGKTIVILESSMRRDLQFDDEDDETVTKEMEDRMEKAATTTSSLEAEQDSGSINRTQSMATLNEPSPQGTGSGSGPRCQDTILGDAEAQTRFETTSKQSNDLPLLRVNTLGSGEDRMKLKELMDLCTKLSDRVLDLETTKTSQAKEIANLKKRVKNLERKRKSRPPRMNLFKIGTSRRRSLGEEDASK